MHHKIILDITLLVIVRGMALDAKTAYHIKIMAADDQCNITNNVSEA